MTDLSFISLKPTISEAISQLRDRRSAEIKYTQVVIHPDQVYVQVSNVAGGIAFGAQYRVWVVDTCNNPIQEITQRVAISDIIHDIDGSDQIKFEIIALGLEYGGRERLLRFDHTDGGDLVLQSWWSNPILFSAGFFRECSDVAYWNSQYFEGISYGASQVRQNVTLRGLFRSGDDDDGEVFGYRQQSGREVSANAISSPRRGFNWQWANYFSYKRLNAVLRHENIYIDGERMTNKVILKGGEYLGSSNIMESTFSACIDENDTYDQVLQVLEPLMLVSTSLEDGGTYTVDSAFIQLGANTLQYYQNFFFNRDVEFNGDPSAIEAKAYLDGNLFYTFDYNNGDIGIDPGILGLFTVISGDPSTDIFGQNGEWRITVSQGAVKDMYGQESEAIDITVTIGEAEYDAEDYEDNEYFAA